MRVDTEVDTHVHPHVHLDVNFDVHLVSSSSTEGRSMGEDPRPGWAIRLQAERRARQWSKHEMARRLFIADGIRQGSVRNLARQIARHESGEVFPRDWADAYAAVFGMSRTDLFGEPVRRERGRSASPVGTVEERARPGDGDEDVRRRTLLELLTALGAGATVPLATAESALAALETSLGGPAGEKDVTDWQNTAWEYSQTIWVHPVGVLMKNLTSDITALAVAIRQEPRSGTRRELLRVSAQLTTYMAQELSDMGELREARRSFHAATQAADASGDRDLASWVRCYHATTAFWEGRPTHVITKLLDDAFVHVPNAPSVGLAKALKTRAHLQAAQGDKAGAEATLHKLYGVYEGLPTHITQDHITPHGFSENSLSQGDAFIYAFLGDTKRAVSAIDKSLSLLPPERKGSRANIHLVHSLALIHDGDIAEGLSLATGTHEGMPTSTSRRLITREIIKALPDGKARALPAARELYALASAKT